MGRITVLRLLALTLVLLLPLALGQDLSAASSAPRVAGRA